MFRSKLTYGCKVGMGSNERRPKTYHVCKQNLVVDILINKPKFDANIGL